MKIAFKIPPIDDLKVEVNLLIEAGKDDISFLLYSKNPFTIQGLFSYSLHNIDSSQYFEDVKKIISEFTVLQSSNISNCNIFFNYPTSSLIPLQYFVEDKKENMHELMFGADKSRMCFEENVNMQNFKNIYTVPQNIYNSLLQLYPNSKFSHSTSSQLNIESNNENFLHCIIYSSSIKVLLFKAGKLQIVQYFDYTTPADVCYHLLNVANGFQVSASSLTLIISGLIDAKSNLYEELYKYFLHIFFAEIKDVMIAENLNELQPHFYHHLTALATCV